MKLITETTALRVEHEFEVARLIRKSNNQILIETEFYGDIQCGLIDTENQWAILAGEFMVFWTVKFQREYRSELFKDIYALRLSSNGETIDVLTDPWSDISAIWTLTIKDGELVKKTDFIDYKGKAHIDNVEW